jgi:hypothetical protein
MYLQLCINQQQKPISVMNAGELINLQLLTTTDGKWTASTKGTKQLIPIKLVTEHVSGQFFLSNNIEELNHFNIL